MKKILSAVLCAVLILSLMPSVNAVVSGELVYEVFEDYVEITGVNPEESSIEIPREIEGKPVTKIGYRAFANSYMREVTLPDTITEIGAGAFLDCLFLKKIVIPDGVSEIKYQTFRGCTLLREVYIPKSVTFIDDEAFYRCSSLKVLSELSKDLYKIGESAFLDCHSLEGISVDSGNLTFTSKDGVLYTQDGKYLYLYPAGKKGEFKIPNEVKVIGEDAFEFSVIEEIVIPESVESVNGNAFHLSKLKSVVFEGKANIGDCAFLQCENLEKVVIYDAFANLGENVFDMCEKATLYAPKGSDTFNYGKRAGLYEGYVDENGKLSRPFQMPKIDWGKWLTILGAVVVLAGGFVLYLKFGKKKDSEAPQKIYDEY